MGPFLSHCGLTKLEAGSPYNMIDAKKAPEASNILIPSPFLVSRSFSPARTLPSFTIGRFKAYPLYLQPVFLPFDLGPEDLLYEPQVRLDVIRDPGDEIFGPPGSESCEEDQLIGQVSVGGSFGTKVF
jgi:hypothetical protein